MRSPAAPLLKDIREWAYQENAVEPLQDWDLILSWRLHDLYIDLAGSPDCPNQIYFLKLLYFIVGDSVRYNFKNHTEDSLRDFIRKGAQGRPYCVHLWANRSLKLLQDPKQFVYDDWCGGKLVLSANDK